MAMRMIPRSLLLLLVLTAATDLLCAEGANDARPDLTVTDYDTVFMKNGAGTVLGTIDTSTTGGIAADGSILIQELGQNGNRIIKAEQFDHIVYRTSFAKAIEKRGAWDLAHNQAVDQIDDVIKTINRGRTYVAKDPAQATAAKDAAFALAQKAMNKWPTNIDVGELMLTLLEEKGDAKGVEALARRLVKSDPHWTEGYAHVAKVLQADPAREDEFKTWLSDWLKVQPTAYQPNKFMAGLNEKNGQLRAAQEAYRKCYEMHKDLESGLGYARVSLARGEVERALDAANALIGNEQFADEAKAIVGSVKLAQGDVQGAQGLLQEALKGKLNAAASEMARYNLALACMRGGQADQARELWGQVATPLAKLALACLDRKAFTEVESLPTAGLKLLAKELNACVGLEHGNSGDANALDPTVSKRDLFLTLLGKLELNSGAGGDAQIRELQAFPGVESLRWQAYGFLLAHHYAEAEAVCAQLPADDGYAIAYRVCAAEGLKQPDRAKAQFVKMAAASNAPRDWMARVEAIYASANDELVDEKFGWPDGDTPQGAWQYSAPGTGIHIHSLGGQLVFEGAQTASTDPVSRAWKMAQQDRLKQAQLDVDLAGVSSATVGLEFLDDARRNGVELGVHGDNRLAWRELKSGVWGQWQNLALQFQGTRASLCIEYNLGRFMAFTPDDPLQKYPMGDGLAQPTAQMCVSIFGTAEPGVTWKAAATRIQIQMKPVTGGAKTRRLGDG